MEIVQHNINTLEYESVLGVDADNGIYFVSNDGMFFVSANETGDGISVRVVTNNYLTHKNTMTILPRASNTIEIKIEKQGIYK